MDIVKNYSLLMLGCFLAVGTILGIAFPYMLQSVMAVPAESMTKLRLLSLGTGLVIGFANFTVYYIFIHYTIRAFRIVLARVRDEDYKARVELSGDDMLGLLADDVNFTLSHLEEKNDEVLLDELTGLPNRQFLKQYYRKNSRCLAHEKTAFLFFDLDKFKGINDQYGHLYGDRVLMEVSNRIGAALSEGEFLVRLSGDEFLLVAKLSESCTTQYLAEQLMKLFIEPFEIHGTMLQIQTSIGVSLAPEQGTEMTELIRKADFAMYQAKKTEGISYRLFEEHAAKEMTEMAESC